MHQQSFFFSNESSLLVLKLLMKTMYEYYTDEM